MCADRVLFCGGHYAETGKLDIIYMFKIYPNDTFDVEVLKFRKYIQYQYFHVCGYTPQSDF